MINQVFATKRKMTQAWTKSGKRLAVTCLDVKNNVVVNHQDAVEQTPRTLQIGYGTKKLKNMAKPLRSQLEKSGFSLGVAQLRRVATAADETLTAGDSIKVEDVLHVGDVVKVQGTTKGRGYGGVVKRHGFRGGPKTHGQSDRHRAPGSIGNRTIPGRVFKGKRMSGHYGTDVQTVQGLVVLHIDPTKQEVWLSGPVPGAMKHVVRITATGKTKDIELDEKASGVAMAQPEMVAAPEAAVETPATDEVKQPEAEGAAV